MRDTLGHSATWTIILLVGGVPLLLGAIKGFVALLSFCDWIVG